MLHHNNFTTQAPNVKGKFSEIMSMQVPSSYREYRLAQIEPATMYFPFLQIFKLEETGAAAKDPLVHLDYPIADNSALDLVHGDNLFGYYSEDGISYSAGTEVSVTPASMGEFKVDDLGAGAVETYLPASDSIWWKFYFRPAAGSLFIGKKNDLEMGNNQGATFFEKSFMQLHQADQLKSNIKLTFGVDAVVGRNEFITISAFMPNVTATQSTETAVTKTVLQEALFVPYTTDQIPWGVPQEIGDIAIPLGVVRSVR